MSEKHDQQHRHNAKMKRRAAQKAKPAPTVADSEDTKPDYSGKCENCGASPILPLTGMCGPCTFGEADTADGNW